VDQVPVCTTYLEKGQQLTAEASLLLGRHTTYPVIVDHAYSFGNEPDGHAGKET
jgi:hypothetical protein